MIFDHVYIRCQVSNLTRTGCTICTPHTSAVMTTRQQADAVPVVVHMNKYLVKEHTQIVEEILASLTPGLNTTHDSS